jgi:hypothetical protein
MARPSRLGSVPPKSERVRGAVNPDCVASAKWVVCNDWLMAQFAQRIHNVLRDRAFDFTRLRHVRQKMPLSEFEWVMPGKNEWVNGERDVRRSELLTHSLSQISQGASCWRSFAAPAPEPVRRRGLPHLGAGLPVCGSIEKFEPAGYEAVLNCEDVNPLRFKRFARRLDGRGNESNDNDMLGRLDKFAWLISSNLFRVTCPPRTGPTGTW